jgi:putative FmdB family regulatory protein
VPIYEYEPDAGACEKCGGRFEVLQSIHDEPLTACPECGKACHRVLSAFTAGTAEKDLLSEKNLKRHGFTRYERTGDGTYEKTVGKGPDQLGADGD